MLPQMTLLRSRFAGWLILVVALLGSPGRSEGNGWEHGTVSFEALVAALRSESADMRTKATESLGYRGETRGTPPLLELLGRPEPSHRVRAAAYTALGLLADHQALPALERCLRDETREEIRGTASLRSAGSGARRASSSSSRRFKTTSTSWCGAARWMRSANLPAPSP